MSAITFKSFAESILAGDEGVFMSVRNEVAGHKVYTGTGHKITADFDAGPFPLFSVHDFTGKNGYHWHFENFETGVFNPKLDVIEGLENYDPGLELDDLEAFTGETNPRFVQKIKQLQAAARAGEFWVANFTQNLGGVLPQDVDKKKLVLKVFYEFLKLGKNHCGGVVVTKEQLFCSLSPETFLLQNESELRTFPIKGTGSELSLTKSEKEKAELSMITDLMRNDLGQIGTKVWLERERYLTEENGFYHARAEVCAELQNSVLTKVEYEKLLPAGSISGAPKARVLKLLSDLESFDRNFYTGTFGVRLSPEKSIFNILIRTIFLDAVKNEWCFPVGAGITIESAPAAEWDETLQKAQILRDCLKPKLLP